MFNLLLHSGGVTIYILSTQVFSSEFSEDHETFFLWTLLVAASKKTIFGTSTKNSFET